MMDTGDAFVGFGRVPLGGKRHTREPWKNATEWGELRTGSPHGRLCRDVRADRATGRWPRGRGGMGDGGVDSAPGHRRMGAGVADGGPWESRGGEATGWGTGWMTSRSVRGGLLRAGDDGRTPFMKLAGRLGMLDPAARDKRPTTRRQPPTASRSSLFPASPPTSPFFPTPSPPPA
jgi:hypothetical protein